MLPARVPAVGDTPAWDRHSVIAAHNGAIGTYPPFASCSNLKSTLLTSRLVDRRLSIAELDVNQHLDHAEDLRGALACSWHIFSLQGRKFYKQMTTI